MQLLPSVGEKSAQRLAFFLLKSDRNLRAKIGKSILQIDENLNFCEKCFHFSDGKFCQICLDESRDRQILCVVEDWLDLIAIEKSGIFRGVFHVLGGAISPLENIGIDDLRIAELQTRAKNENFAEIILATNATLEGEATAMAVFRALKNFENLKITKLARGLPFGGGLQFSDEKTLQRSFEARGLF